MTSILEEFAYGNLSPKVYAFRHDSEYEEVLRVLSLNEERLLARLNKEDKNVFENYAGAQGELNRLTAVGNLIYGYQLGLTMTAEAFVGMNDLTFDKTDNQGEIDTKIPRATNNIKRLLVSPAIFLLSHTFLKQIGAGNAGLIPADLRGRFVVIFFKAD